MLTSTVRVILFLIGYVADVTGVYSPTAVVTETTEVGILQGAKSESMLLSILIIVSFSLMLCLVSSLVTVAYIVTVRCKPVHVSLQSKDSSQAKFGSRDKGKLPLKYQQLLNIHSGCCSKENFICFKLQCKSKPHDRIKITLFHAVSFMTILYFFSDLISINVYKALLML